MTQHRGEAMTQPRTEAGRALLSDWDDRMTTLGAVAERIVTIEREAYAAGRQAAGLSVERLAEAIHLAEDPHLDGISLAQKSKARAILEALAAHAEQPSEPEVFDSAEAMFEAIDRERAEAATLDAEQPSELDKRAHVTHSPDGMGAVNGCPLCEQPSEPES
jgi:hypothetical protein